MVLDFKMNKRENELRLKISEDLRSTLNIQFTHFANRIKELEFKIYDFEEIIKASKKKEVQNVQDVKKAVLKYRNKILKKYKNMYSEVLIKDFDKIFGDFEK